MTSARLIPRPDFGRTSDSVQNFEIGLWHVYPDIIDFFRVFLQAAVRPLTVVRILLSVNP